MHETVNKTQGEPVKFRFAGELETVVFVHSGTEDQVKLQGFLWEQSSKSIIGLDVYTLQKTTQWTWHPVYVNILYIYIETT